MIFSEVPGAVVDRNWRNISVLLSNVFRVRGLSKDNQFRISLAIGFTDSDSIPIIVSQKTLYVQSAVWQEVRVPLKQDYSPETFSIYARISDVQWGARGQTSFLLKEGSRMIYDAPDIATQYSSRRITGEVHSYHGPAAVLVGAGARVEIPANPKRKTGFIYQNYTNPVFVYFSDPVPAGNIDKNTAKVSKGGRIDIPDDYTGKIFIDVKGQFSPDPGLLCCVQYEGEAVLP